MSLEKLTSNAELQLSAIEALTLNLVLFDITVQQTVIAYRKLAEAKRRGGSHSQDKPLIDKVEQDIIAALKEINVTLDPREVDAFATGYPLAN